MQKMYAPWKRNGKGSLYNLDDPIPESAWVLEGQGFCFGKIDGAAAMIRSGRLYRRRCITSSSHVPRDFLPASRQDAELLERRRLAVVGPVAHDKIFGWLPVDLEFENDPHWRAAARVLGGPDGTYELLAPTLNGNPHHVEEPVLVNHKGTLVHGAVVLLVDEDGNPRRHRTAQSIKNDLARCPQYEGFVFRHEDGERLVKVHRHGFGLPWPLAIEPCCS